nr:SIALI-17 repeat-containing surface protein [Streptococcus mitis]
MATAKTAADEAQAKFDEVNEVVKAYKDEIDKLTDDYNATLGYIENLKEVPKGEGPKDFSGGVNDDEVTAEEKPEFNGSVNAAEAATTEEKPEFNGGVNAAEAATTEEKPEFNGGVNAAEAATTEEKPEFNGGVNAVEAAVNEVPEFNGGVNAEEAPTTENTPEFNGGVNDDNAPTEPSKPEASVEKAKGPKDEIERLEAEIKKLETNVQDAEANGAEDYLVEGYKRELDKAKAELEELKAAWLNLVNEKPEFDLSKLNEGKLPESNKENTVPSRPEKPAPDFPIPAKVGTPGNPPRENSDTTAVNEPALVPKTPSTPAVAPTVAGTNKDNTYQAPAAKAEDKKELPNTGGKDNVAIASLGFLGLLLGALPFVKRKN